MHFDNCSTIEEMVEVRDNLFSSINDEFKIKSRQLSSSKANKLDKFIFKNRELSEEVITYMAFPLSPNKGKSNEVVFFNDGSAMI